MVLRHTGHSSKSFHSDSHSGSDWLCSFCDKERLKWKIHRYFSNVRRERYIGTLRKVLVSRIVLSRIYSAHWIQRLASVKGVEVAIDSVVAISRAFNYDMVHFYKQNIDYSDLMLDIATDTGRKYQILRSLQTSLLFMQQRRSGDRVKVLLRRLRVNNMCVNAI